MTTSAAQAAAFYEEAVREQPVWGARDSEGFPAPLHPRGERAMPFWSLESRARRIVERVDAYGGFEIVPISLEAFRGRWLPGLAKDYLRVGLNWSGKAATGYDVHPTDVMKRLAADLT